MFVKAPVHYCSLQHSGASHFDEAVTADCSIQGIVSYVCLMNEYMLTLVFGLQVCRYKEVFCLSEHSLIAKKKRIPFSPTLNKISILDCQTKQTFYIPSKLQTHLTSPKT